MRDNERRCVRELSERASELTSLSLGRGDLGRKDDLRIIDTRWKTWEHGNQYKLTRESDKEEDEKHAAKSESCVEPGT